MSSDASGPYVDGESNVKAGQGMDFVNWETQKKKRGGILSVGIIGGEDTFSPQAPKTVFDIYIYRAGDADFDALFGNVFIICYHVAYCPAHFLLSERKVMKVCVIIKSDSS